MDKEEIEKIKEYFKNWEPMLFEEKPELINYKWEYKQDWALKKKTDILLNYIHHLETRIKESEQNDYWKGYIQKQNEAVEICKMCKYRTKLKKLEEREQKIKELIKQLDIDEKNTRTIKNNENYIDDYKKCRLKAYMTKTREIKNRLLHLYKEEKNK